MRTGLDIRYRLVTISLDDPWLLSDNVPTMAPISQTRESSANIRVALVIESGKLKPVWFEQTDKRARDRIFVKEICSTWSHHQGSAKIWNFAVTAGGNGYRARKSSHGRLAWSRSRSSHPLMGAGIRIEIGSSGVLDRINSPKMIGFDDTLHRINQYRVEIKGQEAYNKRS